MNQSLDRLDYSCPSRGRERHKTVSEELLIRKQLKPGAAFEFCRDFGTEEVLGPC